MAGNAYAPLKLYFDGGCRPNPGVIEIAVVARGRTFHRTDAGFGTNDDAEWLALLYALDVARSFAANDLLLVGDSALVVNQASGAAKCRSHDLQRHLDAFAARATSFARVRLRQVRRHRNLAGIAIEQARAAV